MSRIGKMPIIIPASVTVDINNDEIKVNGPKGALSQTLLEGIKVEIKDNEISLSRHNDEPKNRANHGLMRSLINNLVVGVTEGFVKKLEVNGVGFRVAVSGSDLKMNLGFSHEVVYKIPTGINISVEQNIITVSGISKQQVGQVAADIRKLKKPEPYKGKGIKYIDERILRKSGKSGKEK